MKLSQFNYVSESINGKYFDLLMHFFDTGILLHHNLQLSEKLELAYVLDYFGLDLLVNSYKYRTIDELRYQLILYAKQSGNESTMNLVEYLIPDIQYE